MADVAPALATTPAPMASPAPQMQAVLDKLAALGARPLHTLTIEAARTTPYLLVGTVEEIVEKVIRCEHEWGISYFVVRTLGEFAPVIAALR